MKRISFVHQENHKFFLKIHERYQAVSIKYFKQIFLETFSLKNLSKLAVDYVI